MPTCSNCHMTGHRINTCPNNVTISGNRAMTKMVLDIYRQGNLRIAAISLSYAPDTMGRVYNSMRIQAYRNVSNYQNSLPLNTPSATVSTRPEPKFDESADCPVCLEENVFCRAPPCNHNCCLDCYKSIKETDRNATCPMCRGPM